MDKITYVPESGGKSLRDVFRFEWPVLAAVSLLLFVTASVFMSGWPSGLIPNLQYPYSYDGDGLFILATIKKVIEGAWIYINGRLGFPFCGNSYAYPIPDSGSLLLLKVLGKLFGSPQAAMNMFFLLGFPVTFICSYVFLRVVGLSRSFSAVAGILFAFLPFHFQRLNHLFFTWYFVVPIFFYFGYNLFFYSTGFLRAEWSISKAVLSAVVLFVSASFGVYYAFFGCLLLFASAAAGAIRNNTSRCFMAGLAVIAVVVCGVLVNTAPNIIHKMASEHKNNVASRGPAESEVYGLKLIQLLLPREGHRVRIVDKAARRYARKFPLVNENATSALGVIGAAGLLLLLGTAFAALSGGKVDARLVFLSLITLFLILFATIGGFSSLFAFMITSQLRAWNRISVFIGFGAISVFFLILQTYLQKHFLEAQARRAMLPVAVCLCFLGVFDQTSPASVSSASALRANFDSDHAFVKGIEAIVPGDSAIYQLPYVPFPEAPTPYQLPEYALFAGFLHSTSLRWSYGGIKREEGDSFLKALSMQPLEGQVAEISRLGFAGIYVDRRGFEDHGRGVEGDLRRIFKSGPRLQSADGNLSFFLIP